jgi:uncharacterized protein (DUF2267 family)
MEYQAFIKKVQTRAGLDTLEMARRTTQVILGTLGERLYRTERGHLAAQLPDELAAYLNQHVVPQTTERQVDQFSLEEFYNRVSARLDRLAYVDAVERSQATVAVLRQAVTAGEWDHITSELPWEYKPLVQGER